MVDSPLALTFTREGRRETESAYLRGDDVAWEETLSLPEARVAAIQQIDAASEALRVSVINRMPTQTEDYQAQAWRAAGYPETDDEPAPPDVSNWAMAKWRDGWTARQAADDILAEAGRWAAVLSEGRLLCLVNTEDVRHAGTSDEVASIVANMEADISTLAQQLNLNTAR